jgi:putative ABC transport system substrate-binding protein
MIHKREFITLVGGAAAAWPLAARGQQRERVRRVAFLSVGADDVSNQTSAFRDALAKLGWVEGSNLHIEIRFSGDSDAETRKHAAELLALAPDVIVTRGGFATGVMQQLTQTIPIVTAGAGDLISSGVIKDMAHPEGNVTGVTNRVRSIEGKLLELLREAAPGLRRIAVLRPADSRASFVQEIDEFAQPLALKAVHIPYRTAVDVVRGVDAFAAEGGGGLLVSPPGLLTSANRRVFLQLAAQYRLPTVSQFREFAAEGWMISYGSDLVDQGRRAAFYVDRLLRGAKVSELPVELPAKFDLIINLKTAKALGLAIPIALLSQADEVIE